MYSSFAHKIGTPIENSHILWIRGVKQAHTAILNTTPQNEGFWLKLGLLLSLFKHTVCNCYCTLYCRNSSLEVEDPYSSFASIEHLNRYTFMKTDSYCVWELGLISMLIVHHTWLWNGLCPSFQSQWRYCI